MHVLYYIRERLETAINEAHEKLDIKPLMEASDFLGEGIDEKSVITYVSEYFKKFSDMNKQESLIKCINGAVEVSRKHEQFKIDVYFISYLLYSILMV